jgi:hypothetical protein
VLKAARALAVPFVLPAALLLAPGAVGTADASSICRMLEQRIAAVAAAPRAGGRAKLERAVARSRADGCGASGYASPRDHHCRAHADRIDRLRNAGASSAGLSRSDVRRETQRLKAAQRANACFDGPAAATGRVASADRTGTPIRTIDGTIPVPLPRPASPSEIYQAGYVEHGESRVAAQSLERARELARARDVPADRLAVRVVGGKFLPDPNEEMDFMAIATTSDNPANEVLGQVLATIEGYVVSGAVAAER